MSSENDMPEPLDEHERFEVLMSGSGLGSGRFNELNGLSTVFPGGRPDAATADRFVRESVARHHQLVDAFAEALTSDEASIEAAASALDDSMLSLGVARALFSPEVTDAGDEPDLHSDWLDENLDIEQGTPPEAEVPVVVELGILLHEGQPLIRAREALVFSKGFILTLDIALRDVAELTRDERHAFDEALSQIPEQISVAPDSGLDASPHSRWSRVFHRSAVGWAEVWVEGTPAAEPISFTLSARFPGIDGEITFSLDGARILEARRRVVDVSSPQRTDDGESTTA